MDLAPAQLNLVVRDLGASIIFYRRLGWPVRDPTGPHAVAVFDNFTVDFDETPFAAMTCSRFPGHRF